MTLDLQRSAAVTLNFDKVQGLRDLEDTVLSLSAYCKGSLRVIEMLRTIPGADFQGMWSLESYIAQLLDYGENLAVLTSRIGNTINLVSLESGFFRVVELMSGCDNAVCLCFGPQESVHRRKH